MGQQRPAQGRHWPSKRLAWPAMTSDDVSAQEIIAQEIYQDQFELIITAKRLMNKKIFWSN